MHEDYHLFFRLSLVEHFRVLKPTGGRNVEKMHYSKLVFNVFGTYKFGGTSFHTHCLNYLYNSSYANYITMFSMRGVSMNSMCAVLIGLAGLNFNSVANGQSFIPPVFDQVDPVDLMGLAKGNTTFLPYKMGVLAMPIMCTTPSEIIESAVNMASGNGNGGNNTIQAIKELAMGQAGIGENLTGQELQEALNLVVCIPSMMNDGLELGDPQNNLTSNMKDGMLIQ